MLTVQEVAAELGMSERFVRREISAGRLSSHRFGRSVRIDSAEVHRYKLARCGVPAPAANDNRPARRHSRGHAAALSALEKLLA